MSSEESKSITELTLNNPTISDGRFGKFIKADDSNTKQIIDSFNENGTIIITAHLDSNKTDGKMGTNSKIEPKLVLDTMYLNPDMSIVLSDINKGFKITSGGLIESNTDSNIKVKVLGPLKSLLSVTEVKQGSEGALQPAADSGNRIAPDVNDRDILGILNEVESKTKEILDMIIDDSSQNDKFKNILETMQTNKTTILGKNDSRYKNDVENLYKNIDIYLSKTYTSLDDVQEDCKSFSDELQTIRSQVNLMVGGSTRRRKYKKRTTRRNKRRTYRYKK